MTIYVSKNDDIKDYLGAIVYLREGQVPKLEVPGKIVSVESDNYRLKIQTETHTAVFNAEDVTAVNFMK